MKIDIYYPRDDKNFDNTSYDYYWADAELGHSTAYDFMLSVEPYDSTNLKVSGYVVFYKNVNYSILDFDPSSPSYVSVSGDVAMKVSYVDKGNDDVTIAYFNDTIVAGCSSLDITVKVTNNWHDIHIDLKLYNVLFKNYNNVCTGTFSVRCYHGQQITAPKQVKELYSVCWNEKYKNNPTVLLPEETFIFDATQLNDNFLEYNIICKPYTNRILFDCTGGMDNGVSNYDGFYNVEKGFKIPNCIPIENKYLFVFWSTEKDGKGTIYYPNDLYVFTEDNVHVTLYANWVRKGIMIFEEDNTIAANDFITSNRISIDENDKLYAPSFAESDIVMIKKDGVYAKGFVEKPIYDDISDYVRELLISSDDYTFTDVNGLLLYVSKEEK